MRLISKWLLSYRAEIFWTGSFQHAAGRLLWQYPFKAKNCLGLKGLKSGQSRVPKSPQRITV